MNTVQQSVICEELLCSRETHFIRSWVLWCRFMVISLIMYPLLINFAKILRQRAFTREQGLSQFTAYFSFNKRSHEIHVVLWDASGCHFTLISSFCNILLACSCAWPWPTSNPMGCVILCDRSSQVGCFFPHPVSWGESLSAL